MADQQSAQPASFCAFSAFAPIVVLLLACGPITVAGLIVSVVVPPVDAMESRWAPPHVGEEVLERVPAFAHFDTASPIVSILLMPWIQTATFHLRPSSVLGGVRATIRTLSVCSRRLASFNSKSATKAAARACVARAQVVGHDGDLFATIAMAMPRKLAANALWGFRKYGETTETFSDEINGEHGAACSSRKTLRHKGEKSWLTNV